MAAIGPWLKKIRVLDWMDGHLGYRNKQYRQEQQILLCISLVVTGLMVGMRQLGFSQPWELAAYDQLVQSQPILSPDPRLLVITITESDIQQQQQWPLSDEVIAKALAKIQSHRPRVIGLDIYRDFPQPPGHQDLQQQLQAENVIVIENLGDLSTEQILPPSRVPQERVGFNDLLLDADGIVRRNLLFADLGDRQVYSLSLQLSLHYFAQDNLQFALKRDYIQLGEAQFDRLERHPGGYQKIDNAGYQTLLRYRTWRDVSRTISLSQLIEGEVKPSWVEDKIVLIGTTALSQKDNFLTPYSAIRNQKMVMSGVMMHAQMTSQILSAASGEQDLLGYWPDWFELAWIWGWAYCGGLISIRVRRVSRLVLATTGGFLSLGGITYVLFTQAIWIPVAIPALGFAGASTLSIAYKAFRKNLYDADTGLPNRNLLLRHLKNRLDYLKEHRFDVGMLAVLFLDLDRFNTINENFGHTVSNQLLKKVADRLQAQLPPSGFLANLGEDKFVVLLEHCKYSQAVLDWVDQLQTDLVKPIRLPKVDNHEIVVSASVGIALSEVAHDYQPEHLLQDAQTAMYRAKALGKGRYELFSMGMRTQSKVRFSVESDLRQALERQEFRLHYQPIFCLKTNQVQGFEALVRWQHPKRGLIYPGDFISLAEETGLIVPLGYWVLKEACRQTAQWQQQYPDREHFFMSVNLSGRQFTESDLADQVSKILQETQIDPKVLKLELTESVVMDDVEASISALLQLKALGLQMSIDDFGTGYSSLSYLHRFPIDTLKVDRSFVMRMEDASENAEIVKTIISLGHNLGMTAIAEGIEMDSQAQSLRDLNCEYGQGYFFSKPIPPEAAENWLKQELS